MTHHNSRFKAYLIPRDEVRIETVVLAPMIDEIAGLWHRGSITSPEAALLFVVSYLETRKQGVWCMRSGQTLVREPIDPMGLDFRFSKLSERFDFLKNRGAANFTEWISCYNLRKLPGAILRTLLVWRQGQCRLQLTTKAVSPEAMLETQARGERIVTLAFDAARAGETVDGQRDAFEFLLHDLVHADLFFGEGHQEQRRFFQSVEKVVASGVLAHDLRTNPVLCKDFHYLISDMNSNAHHLTQHFCASLLKHQLFCEQKSADGILSDSGRKRLAQRLTLLQEIARFDVQLVAQSRDSQFGGFRDTVI